MNITFFVIPSSLHLAVLELDDLQHAKLLNNALGAGELWLGHQVVYRGSLYRGTCGPWAKYVFVRCGSLTRIEDGQLEGFGTGV